MLKVEDFLKAGYKKFANPGINSAEYGLQKCISDEKGKKYFIDVWVYDFSMYKQVPEHQWNRFSSEANFESKDLSFKTTLIQNEKTTVKNIEEFFESIWVKLGCGYYKLWD